METLKEGRILFVEDDEGIRDWVEYALKYEGYEVTTAEDGQTALELVSRERPDLIVLDMTLTGMDGEEFSRRYNGNAPIIAATGSERDRYPNLTSVAGWLRKPYGPDELLETVGRHINSHMLVATGA